MNIKINNAGAINKAGKSKKSSASSEQSSSFADALDNVTESQETTPTQSIERVKPFNYDLPKSKVPQYAKDRGHYILDLLEELEKDILAGRDTNVVAKLEEALAVIPEDKSSLPQAVQELLEQIEVRAVIELEKLKNMS